MSTSDHPTPEQEMHQKLCAYVFGELAENERREVEAELLRSPELRAERERLEATVGFVQSAMPADRLSDDMRATLSAAAQATARRGRFRLLRGGSGVMRMAAGLALLIGGVFAARMLFPADRFAPSQMESGDRVARAPASRPAELGAELERDFAGGLASEAAKEELAQQLYERRANEKSEVLDSLVSREDESNLRAQNEIAQASRGSRALAPDTAPELKDAEEAEEAPALELAFSQAAPDPADPAAVAAAPPAATEPVPDRQKRGPLDTGPSTPSAPVVRNKPEGGTTYTWRDTQAGEEKPGADSIFLGRGEKKKQEAPEGEAEPDFLSDSPFDAESFDNLVALGGGAGGKRGAEKSRGRLERLRELGYADGYEEGEGAEDDRKLDEDTLKLLEGLGYVGDDKDKEDDAFRFRARQELAAGQERAGGRRVVLAPEELERLGERLIQSTRIQPGESAVEMFFRCWGESPFELAARDSESTFSIDVDTASYTRMRRTLNAGRFPVRAQIRTEEFVNYFKADRPAPADGVFALGLEAAPSLFHADPNVEMLRVTVRGKDVTDYERQPVALTFVVDVSGSMEEGGRLELVKEALLLLCTQLSPLDSLAVVTFSNQAILVSPMLSAANRGPVEDAISRLTPEGGTNVEGGLALGYEHAATQLTPDAVNRVVLLSDGVGNIGETDQRQLLDQVAEQRGKGIYLNTIGVGLENHDDDFLEQLADRGDGVCQYMDSAREAERALVQGFTQTLQPIARDVKIQVAFDPAQVESYRLLGYENRAIADQLFRDDAVDAGEVNAGHQATALYEIVRTGVRSTEPFATARVRYKPPFAVDNGQRGAGAQAAAETAVEIQASIGAAEILSSFDSASAGYRRSVLVAQFAELLRRSIYARGDSLELLVAEATKLDVELAEPDFKEFLALVKLALPRLREIEAEESDELRRVFDTLCRLHYEEGQGELLLAQADEVEDLNGILAEDVREAQDAKNQRKEEIEALEARLRELLAERLGGPELDPTETPVLETRER